MAWENLDFSPIANLPNVYRQARQQAVRERTLAELGRGASINDVATRLFQAGDVQSGLALSQLANANAQQDWNRTYQGGMLGVAQQNMKPEVVKTAEAAGLKPGTPEFTKAVFPKTDTPISATDKKIIIDAEDEVPQITGTLEALKRAKELNSQTFTGYTAGLRGAVATKVPGGGALFDKNAGLATEEWSKIMGPEALQVMASTLKGATTDFELRTYIGMLADPATHPDVRGKVIDRMEKLAERKMQIQQSRVKDLRGGTYFKPEQSGKPMSQADYNALPSGAQYTAPDGSVRTKR